MKTIRVAAAIMIEQGKVFATQRGYGELKMDGNFQEEKLSQKRHRKMPLCER